MAITCQRMEGIALKGRSGREVKVGSVAGRDRGTTEGRVVQG